MVDKTKQTMDHSKKGGITTREADGVIDSVGDLINDNNYRPFFYKHLYRLGPVRFLETADRARGSSVDDRGRLFTKLLLET